eukprot:4820630-Prymnesium_polylepis.1
MVEGSTRGGTAAHRGALYLVVGAAQHVGVPHEVCHARAGREGEGGQQRCRRPHGHRGRMVTRHRCKGSQAAQSAQSREVRAHAVRKHPPEKRGDG